ncbi:unnamed protein product [Penicillium salamii]|nr:unnamed protein product [Penicillium salamii]CAG8208554.1 unnamed protein product [Penicillium salamii]CAG8413264.1 unnamed protein product [Penicillium salamii]
MSSANFRLESFRPWNPPQGKAQSLRNPLNIYRYPSPVSLSATPPPSTLMDATLKSQQMYAPRTERHPLPVRPPVEVCLNAGPPPDSQINLHEPEVLERASSIGPCPRTFDFEDILHLQDLSNSGYDDHLMTFGHSGQNLDHQPSFESGDLELAFTAGQHSQFGATGGLSQTGDLPNDTAIDPAILDDHHFSAMEQTQATESLPDVATCPGRSSAENSRFSDKDASFHGRQHKPKRIVKSGRQPSKINNVSVVVESRPKTRTGRPSQGVSGKNVSFSIVRAQFSALSVDDRLQFLSWLFEGALSHCLTTPSSTNDAAASRCISKQDEDMAPKSTHLGTRAEIIDTEHTRSSRKGLRWSVEEDHLLVKLKEKENLAWSEVFKRFGQKFPGRSEGSIQVYWSTTLRKQRLP